MILLSDSDKDLVKTSSVNTKFRFGDGVEVMSLREVQIPVIIGVKKVMIKANVVNNEIPLLLSKSSMKKAQLVLNFNNDTAEVLGHNVKLHCTSSGHYCIPLSSTLLGVDCGVDTSIILHTESLQTLSDDEKWKKAMKLHRQFNHASKEKLCKLVSESDSFHDGSFLNPLRDGERVYIFFSHILFFSVSTDAKTCRI